MSRGDYLRLVVYFFVLYAALRFTLGLLLQAPTAHILSVLLGCSAQGNVLACGPYAYEIIPECTGVVSIALFLALLLVMRIPRSTAVRAAILGSIALYLLDIVRVYLLVRFTHSISAFDFWHMVSWFVSPILIVAYVLYLAK
ncbi:MAG: hypothetical protein GXN93_00225 [Candidatus Diapherotrites archaeon]|nr:hypothetical protein [Candidatus Diapherotrites archaeon]